MMMVCTLITAVVYSSMSVYHVEEGLIEITGVMDQLI